MDIKHLKDYLELKLLRKEFKLQDEKSENEEYDDDFNISCGKAMGLGKTMKLIDDFIVFENELNKLINT